jgi:hypothetical protein
MDGSITMRNRDETEPGAPGTAVTIELPALDAQKVGL